MQKLLAMSTEILLVFLVSFVSLGVARKVANFIGLVDKPSDRKCHHGLIPLVGGISVYTGLCFAVLITKQPVAQGKLYLDCAGILVFVGALDDRFDISAKIRMLVQALVGIIMMLHAGLYLHSFGHVLGNWEIQLGPLGYLVTLLAVWATINAFNMVDGIDGLLGGLSCVSFGTLGILSHLSNHTELAFLSFAMIAAIFPYILLNLGILGVRYKVFMGDAGSTLIGFTTIWLLVISSQGSLPAITPVTALWIIAIPLMDMVAIMLRRLRNGTNPLSPDRKHIHHLIMRTGMSPRQAFYLITLVALLLAAIGAIGEQLYFIPEWFMLVLFLFVFFLYSYCIKYTGRIIRYIKRNKHRLRHLR